MSSGNLETYLRLKLGLTANFKLNIFSPNSSLNMQAKVISISVKLFTDCHVGVLFSEAAEQGGNRGQHSALNENLGD